MSLETHIAGAEDKLLDSLHFAGKTSASYVTERRSVSFAPQAASNFTPQGVRLMRFNLADQNGWLVGDTLRLVMTIHNASANPLSPRTDSPASMFRRVRLIGNGSAMIEDIEEYGRVHEIFARLRSSAERYNDHAEGWGIDAEHHCTLDQPGVADPIPGNKARTVVVKLLSSFLTQGKAIPLNMVPVVLELELDGADAVFIGSGNSWYITAPRLIGDCLTLDNSLQNSYASHILQGKQLPFMMHGLYSVRATIPAGSTMYSLPISRGFTRLSTCYYTFFDSNGGGSWVNYFTAPLVHEIDNTDNTTDTDQCSWNITIGAARYPEFDVSSVQESWYRLALAQLMHTGSKTFSISPWQYRTTKFIGAMNFEKALGEAGHTGVNTRSGSQLTLNFRGLPASIDTIHVILHYEVAVNVSAAGIEVLD
jgi:hypothetical protein